MPDSNDSQIDTGEILRKGLHLLVAAVPLLLYPLGKAVALEILVPMATIALAADFYRARRPSFERFIKRTFGVMMRPEELADAGEVRINGATWVLVSLSALTMLFDLNIAAAAFIMFMVSDAAAALVGSTVGRHRWMWSHRTYEGSVAFVVCAFVVGTFVSDFIWESLIFASIVGAIAESLPGPFNDNVRVPVCMALGLVIFFFLS